MLIILNYKIIEIVTFDNIEVYYMINKGGDMSGDLGVSQSQKAPVVAGVQSKGRDVSLPEGGTIISMKQTGKNTWEAIYMGDDNKPHSMKMTQGRIDDTTAIRLMENGIKEYKLLKKSHPDVVSARFRLNSEGQPIKPARVNLYDIIMKKLIKAKLEKVGDQWVKWVKSADKSNRVARDTLLPPVLSETDSKEFGERTLEKARMQGGKAPLQEATHGTLQPTAQPIGQNAVAGTGAPTHLDPFDKVLEDAFAEILGVKVDKTQLAAHRDNIIGHVKERFQEIHQAMLKNPKMKVRFPRDTRTHDKNNKPREIRYHDLGTGLAMGQWTQAGDKNNKIANAMVNGIGVLIKRLELEFHGRIDFGFVGPDKKHTPPNRLPPSEDYWHVWGANAGNWNLTKGDTITGGGQAEGMGKQGPGVFGMVTTPTAGSKGIRKK